MNWIFWGSTALIAYTYLGYPAWLWLRTHWRSKPVQRSAYSPQISVVMVVRNEEQVLKRKLENLLTLDYPEDLTELLVVSDGSTDRTESILRDYASHPRVSVVLNQFSRGKASGLNDALELAHGDVVVFTDARQRIAPDAVRLMLENFADPEVGCVSGELMLGNSEASASGEGLGLYWEVEKWIRELESASGSVVGATGALYAMRRELLSPLPPETILDDVFLPMQAVLQGSRVVFDERARAWDSLDPQLEREFARKVRTLTGNYQLLQLEPWLLSGSNPIRFEFVSHKLLRLAVPLALFGILAASLVLRKPVYRFALLLQGIVYGLSLLSLARPGRGRLARIANLASAFVLLNTAALVAFANFVSGRKAAWIR